MSDMNNGRYLRSGEGRGREGEELKNRTSDRKEERKIVKEKKGRRREGQRLKDRKSDQTEERREAKKRKRKET